MLTDSENPNATIESIQTIPAIPGRGEQYLSVNLALVSMTELVQVATDLGFRPEPVQIHYPVGSSEFHALLWAGKMNEAPEDMNQRIDTLAERVPTAAIRSVRGTWTHVA